MEVQAYKVPFIGDSHVGKTSLITRFTTNQFFSHPVSTIGISNVQILLSGQTLEFTVNIWDTAGQERFRSIVPLYARGADLVVLVFAVDCPKPLPILDEWYGQLRNGKCPIILCGNKSDLQWQVEVHEIREWAKERNCKVIFTSAQTGNNVKELFGMIGEQLEKSQGVVEAGEKMTMKLEADTDGGCC
jgi:small GTP-binding protein